MRILHLSMLYPPHVMGGAERSVAFLAEAQRAQGHDVAAACTTPGPTLLEERNGIAVTRMPHGTLFWAEDWPKHGRIAAHWRKFSQQFNYELGRRFGRVIDDFAPDVVHTHSLVDVSTTVWSAAARRGVPIVHTLRDYDLMCADSTMTHRGRPCGPRCRAMTFAKFPRHRRVDAVVAVSNSVLATHLEHGFFGHVPSHLRRVVWNASVVDGVGADHVRPPRGGKPFTFGHLGRVTEEKGVGTLIDAARLLPRGNWRILVAGREDDGALRERAKGLPIIFAGTMRAADFFDAVDVTVVPSLWAEPLSRTTLESYAMGIPVIGARSGGIPDLVGHDNVDWLHEPGDADSLADRMAGAMEIGRASLPGRGDFARVLEATRPETVANTYLDLYRDVIAAKGGRRRRGGTRAGISPGLVKAS